MININDLKKNKKEKDDANVLSDLTNGEQLNNSNFDEIIKKLEFQKAQVQLGVTFEKNMELFKKTAPAIYEEFIDYEPTEVQLILENDFTINLSNLNNKKLVYSYDPKEFCKKQVKEYLKNPVVTNINFLPTEPINDDYIHIPLFNKLLADYEKLEVSREVNVDAPIGLLMMIGCGLGYHIEEMLKSLDLVNLCIVEPHKDCFYAALHTIDWTKIHTYFSQEGRMLKLFLGPDDVQAEMMIRPLVETIGLHNIIHTFQYKHLGSDQEKIFTEKYLKDYRMSSHGLGFFDDERVSLAHTISHVSKGFKLFKPGPKNEKLPPAFIVANGPSLDDLLPFLEKEQSNAIVFSAGSTLGSLYKAGIKPDFHVEMERVAFVRDVIETGSDAEYRKGIIALGLNTLHPDALELFDQYGLAKKPNDLGSELLESIFRESNPEATRLEHCNPTVTNSAIGFAIGMGFSEIYLIGVDLGSREDGSHHSKNSFYVDLEKKGIPTGPRKSDLYQVPGNFSEKVNTTQVLDNSRLNVEQLISRYEVNVYNPNYGAKIEGTTTIDQNDMSIPKLEGIKKEIVQTLFNDQFIDINFGQEFAEELKKGLSNNFLDKINDFRLKEFPESISEAVKAMNNVFVSIRRLEKSDPITMMLIRGSTHTIFTPMYKSFIFTTSKEDFEKAYRIGWLAYEEFLQKASTVMKETPYQLDRSKAKVLENLK